MVGYSCIPFHYYAVHALQVELGELKGRLTEVISNCDALCKRIASDGPESLRLSVEPFSVTDVNIASNLRSTVDTSQSQSPKIVEEEGASSPR